VTCYKCGKELPGKTRPGRQDTCPECGSYLHCCLNCRFYDQKAHHECREPQAEWVKDKEMGNFCDYFEAGQGGQRSSSSAADEARNKLDQLFK